MEKITQLKHEDHRFLVVGTSGMLINAVMLIILHGWLKGPLFLSQLISSEVAILSNFHFHHNWTYRGYYKLPFMQRLVKFHASAWTGAFLGSMTLWLLVKYFAIHYLIALCFGAAVGAGWNYVFNKFVIWAKPLPPTPKVEKEPARS